MNKGATQSPRTGRAFFSKILPAIRRLAALTRSPVPIRWMAARPDEALLNKVRSLLSPVRSLFIAASVAPSCALAAARRSVARCDHSLPRVLRLPRPTTQEWGEDRGEGLPMSLLSPALSSIRWRRRSGGLRFCRVAPYRGFGIRMLRQALVRQLRLTLCRLQVGDTAQRGPAATKGARVCDPPGALPAAQRIDKSGTSVVINALRLTEPRSAKSSRPATICIDIERLQICATASPCWQANLILWPKTFACGELPFA